MRSLNIGWGKEGDVCARAWGGSTCMGCGGEEGKEEKTNNLVQDATGIVRHLPLQCVTSYPKNGYFTTRAAE